MAGYNYAAGMSNNAVKAYAHGVMPLSQFKRADYDEVGLKQPVSFYKWLAENRIWQPAERHHSGGGFYNKVDFYDLEELIESIDGEEDELIARWRSSIADKKRNTQVGRRVTGSYPIFGGSRRRPRVVGKVDFTGELLGDWIHMDNGKRKRADGNHISWEYA